MHLIILVHRNVKDELDWNFLDMYNSVSVMQQKLDLMRKPTGTKDNPVRTCRDLFHGQPQSKDGKIKFHSICIMINHLYLIIVSFIYFLY